MIRILLGCTIFCRTLLAGLAMAQQPATVLVDSGAKLVGPIVGSRSDYEYTATTEVLIKVRPTSEFVILEISRGQLGSVANGFVYTTADCSGSPYLQTVKGRLVRRAFLDPRNTDLIITPSLSVIHLKLKSFTLSDGTCQAQSFEDDAARIETLGAMSKQGFTPPFSARVE